MITSYNVTPLKKYTEISYRVKCVTVENERVFGDVYVTQQTRDLVCQRDDYIFPSEYKRQKRNLIQQTLNGPDFMKLNSKRSTGREAVAKSYWQKRSKSMGDTPSVIAFNYEDAGNRDAVAKKPKIYPPPLRFLPPQKEIVITSLVDQLLLDIYGIPMNDKGRSESESTASSLKPRPQHQYLQKARLLLKSKTIQYEWDRRRGKIETHESILTSKIPDNKQRILLLPASINHNNRIKISYHKIKR